jgi:hypothetical protein
MSRSRSALGIDPLDALLGDPTADSRHRRLASDPSSQRKVRATFHLPLALVDEARNATVALSGPPTRLTLARLVEDALRREVQRLLETHNAGSPFPRRDAELVGGRPIRS